MRPGQGLLVVSQLNLGAQEIDARRNSGVVLAFCQLVEGVRIVHSSLCGIGASGGRLGIQIEGCNRPDDEIPSILVIQLARVDRILTRL